MKKILTITLILLLMGCDSLKTSDLIFNDLTVYAPRAGNRVTAGFTNITNNSPDTITINSISSPQFNIVEIHETIMNNGIASMIKINTLTILEKQSVSLKPGGKHLMLIDPVKRISEGEEIRLIFELSNNETMTLNTTAVSRF
ncbi:copper chaperone PCu(A)C [Woeseiaceae bacterium]|jgi:periplasmic copper chaperone A|nr:copper chaperone PCu(A)C [Woeseiaceae bacterium]|tara:strand:+ start:141 stop:569 length:429 start_codon:yes stop_codon:yes gene_type:complete